jgi:hypothetical protein
MAASLEKKPKLKLQVYGTYDEIADATEIALEGVNREIFQPSGLWDISQ